MVNIIEQDCCGYVKMLNALLKSQTLENGFKVHCCCVVRLEYDSWHMQGFWFTNLYPKSHVPHS